MTQHRERSQEGKLLMICNFLLLGKVEIRPNIPQLFSILVNFTFSNHCCSSEAPGQIPSAPGSLIFFFFFFSPEMEFVLCDRSRAYIITFVGIVQWTGLDELQSPPNTTFSGFSSPFLG